MASKQDIDILLDRLYKVASQSDEARSELLDGLQSLQLRLETPEDLNLRFVNLQIQLTGAQVAVDLKLFQILAESTQPLTVGELSSKTGVEASLLRKPSQTDLPSERMNEILKHSQVESYDISHRSTRSKKPVRIPLPRTRPPRHWPVPNTAGSSTTPSARSEACCKSSPKSSPRQGTATWSRSPTQPSRRPSRPT